MLFSRQPSVVSFAQRRLTHKFLIPRSSLLAPRPSAFTLVEMLVAMAITLVMIGAVVTLFANISNSVRNRRATIEMSGQLRHVRNMLQQDLQGATCPGLTWQRPEENQGYIELVEGPHREGYASALIDGAPNATPPRNWPPSDDNPEIDHATSILPTSNLDLGDPTWVTDGAGLGDADDILMLTVRNEHEPFVGRAPKDDDVSATGNVRRSSTRAEAFANWSTKTIESPLAEVVWYAVENPGYTTDVLSDDPSADGFFGEPGMRTIYRRALLIAPWVNPYRLTRGGDYDDTFNDGSAAFRATPGLVRILPDSIDRDDAAQAIAALIAFQERYDLSVRLEWDPLLDTAGGGRWKIVANTLGDLTKRENRYEHHGFFFASGGSSRSYPYALTSTGSGYGGMTNVQIVFDPELPSPQGNAPSVTGNTLGGAVVSYRTQEPAGGSNAQYRSRPFVFPSGNSTRPATARAVLNEEGQIVHVVHGLVPLSGDRRGEDVMLTDALGFDLRVYDPGAPLFGTAETDSSGNKQVGFILEPTDPAWWRAYQDEDNMDSDENEAIGHDVIGHDTQDFPFVGQGAYVDLGYGYVPTRQQPSLPAPAFASPSAIEPWFFQARALRDVYGEQLAPGYAVYDTWSFHYENNGINEDELRFDGSNWAPFDDRVDEATNGLDDPGQYLNPTPPPITVTDTRLGPDDVGERETKPPYDKPLRGMQVVLRLYERDSRQIRQVRVNQSFVPE